MPIRVVCRACQTNYQFPDELLGRSVRCKNCQAVFTAEPADAAQAVQAAPPRPTPLAGGRMPDPAMRPAPARSVLPVVLTVVGVGGLMLVLLCAGLVGFGFYRFKQAAAAYQEEMAARPQFGGTIEPGFQPPGVQPPGGQPDILEVDDVFAKNEPVLPTNFAPVRIAPVDYINRVHVQFSDQQRFGLVCPRLRSPADPEEPKRLTRDPRGITGNTIVRINDADFIWGVETANCRYVKDKGKLMKEVPIPGKDKDRAWQSVWEEEKSRVRVTQSVEIVVGEQTGLYDTAVVKYHVWNRDRTPHKVGVRVLLDTCVGRNDGVAVFVPPTDKIPARLEDKLATLNQGAMPDYLQMLENNDLSDQNAVLAVVGLKVKGGEPLEKVVLCRWPQNSEARWGGTNGPADWNYEPIDKNPNARDAAVVLYWAQANTKPDEHRDLMFTYGLGRVLSDEPNRKIAAADPDLRLTVAPNASMRQPFTVAAYAKAKADETVTLKLPAGLTLADGELTVKTPAPSREGYSVVAWRVKATRAGKYALETTGAGGTARETITVGDSSLFE